MDAQPRIRWMIRRDMPEVLEIEQLCFPDPWTEADFLEALRENYIGHVVECGEEVIGYCIFELLEYRIDLVNLAVHPSCWRRGIGGMMIAKLREKLAPDRREQIRALVREENLPAQLFFRAMRFRCVRTYREDDGDGLEFRLRLNDSRNEFGKLKSVEIIR